MKLVSCEVCDEGKAAHRFSFSADGQTERKVVVSSKAVTKNEMFKKLKLKLLLWQRHTSLPPVLNCYSMACFFFHSPDNTISIRALQIGR